MKEIDKEYFGSWINKLNIFKSTFICFTYISINLLLILPTNNVQAAILGIQLQEHIIDEVMRKMVGPYSIFYYFINY